LRAEFGKLRWKNLLSFGNVWTEYDLGMGGTCLVIGKNGWGKSTFLDAFMFCFFGEPFRDVKKAQLINSVNGAELVVEGEVRSHGHSWVVRRGLKPALFEILRDGVPLPRQAKAADQQKWLEQNVLGFGQKSCAQIVILGAATFMPFMRLPAPIRRKVIEDLLDISALGDMLDVVKRMASNCRSRISEARERERILQERERGKIELLRRLRAAEVDRTTELTDQAIGLRSRHAEIVLEEQALAAEHKKLDPEIAKLVSLNQARCAGVKALESIKSEIQQHRAELARISKPETCARCDKTFNVDEMAIIEAQAAMDRAEEIAGVVAKKIDSIDLKIAKVDAIDPIGKQTTIRARGSELAGETRVILRHLREIEETLAKPRQESDEEKVQLEIAEVRRELTEKLEKIIEEQIEGKRIAAALTVLRDDGVKAKIVKTYVPLINVLVNQHLRSLNFDVSFHLDENFNETIKSRGRDEFSYNSFSEGEKKRIDLALLFTWRDIAKRKNSASTNVVVLDEITDGSLDNEGVEDFVRLLRTTSEDGTAFVISHKGELCGALDQTLLARRVRGFSEITKDPDLIREFINSRG
jgi:DNA repair exonuclease SbcCD ATPase subunit